MRTWNALVFLLVSCLACSAKEASPPAPASPSQNSTAIKLTIVPRTSRPQISAGSGFGIMADLKNDSTKEAYVVPRYLTMTPPPEIDPGTPATWAAVVPGYRATKDMTEWDMPVRLAPGATTTAFWAPGSAGSVQGPWYSRWLGNLKLLNFTPGEYTIKVTALYWPDFESAQALNNNYESQSAEIKVTVVSPQWVILTGAIIGGVIAFFLLPKSRLRPHRFTVFSLFTAALLSAIVTILIARISETQFLVRVTINDVWGAIAIGFVSSAYGTSILRRYFLREQSSTEKPAEKETS